MKSKYQKRFTKRQRGGYSYESAADSVSPSSAKVLIGGVFAEWCGHCKNMHPGFKEVTKQLKEQHGGKLEVKEFSDNHSIDQINSVLSKYGGKLDKVEGYPTTFLISGGKLKMYNGVTDFANNEKAKNGFKDWISGHLSQSGGCSGCAGMQHGGYDFSKKNKKRKSARRTRSRSKSRSRNYSRRS